MILDYPPEFPIVLPPAWVRVVRRAVWALMFQELSRRGRLDDLDDVADLAAFLAMDLPKDETDAADLLRFCRQVKLAYEMEGVWS